MILLSFEAGLSWGLMITIESEEICFLPTWRCHYPGHWKTPGDVWRFRSTLEISKYTQASINYYHFWYALDVDGEVRARSGCWHNHFRFFKNQVNPKQLYCGWRNVELSTRKEPRSLNQAYDHYNLLYLQAKNNMVRVSQTYTPFGLTHQLSPSSKHPKRSSGSSATACCLICAKHGHVVSFHPWQTKIAVNVSGSLS